MLRGGSWNNNHDNARAAFRNHNHPDNRNNNIGFRLVCSAHVLQSFAVRQVPLITVGGMRWRVVGWRGYVRSVRAASFWPAPGAYKREAPPGLAPAALRAYDSRSPEACLIRGGSDSPFGISHSSRLNAWVSAGDGSLHAAPRRTDGGLE